MSTRRTLALLALALAPAALGCARPTASQTPAPKQAAGEKKDSAFKSIAEATKSSRKLEGLFTVYQDTVTGALQLALDESQLGKEYIYFMHTVDGVTEAGHFRGAFRGNNVFTIRRHFDKIEFVEVNSSYYFDPTSALHRAADANISPALLASEKIVARDSSGTVLIKGDDLFLKEVFAQVKPSPNPNVKPGTRFALGTLSKDKTTIRAVKNYPLNTDVIVEYVYDNSSPVVRGSDAVTDARYVSVVVQHSLIEMPENDFQPRYDDPRVGYFFTRLTDLTSTSATPYRDMIDRWYLKKKNPGAALSDPVEPIVFWIENTTPVEFRDIIREGVLRWNRAFEKAGFTNAVVVKVQPDDADWDAGDIRYNVLRWTSSPNPPFGGYGPNFVNPRTGQVLGADIMLEWVYMTNRVRYEKLYETAALSTEPTELSDDRFYCSLGHELHYSTLFGLQALKASGAGEMEMKQLMRDGLTSLVLHEVGHTLGLNHNMKASTYLSPDQMHDKDVTSRTGLTGSVMDYENINLAKPGEPQGEYYTTTPGPYDLWAIEFGYSEAAADPAAERRRLDGILARSTEPALTFGNDADDMRAPGRAIDPRVMVGDMSSDAIGYMSERIGLVRDVMTGLKDKYATPGASYHELRNAYLILTGQHANAATVISRYIGGVYVDRGMVGQSGAAQPFTPVPAAEQRRAMQILRDDLFAPDAFDAPEGLYNYLQMQRRGFDFSGTTEDPKIHARALAIQSNVLDHLLHPTVLTRMSDSRLYGNGYTLGAMMGDLTDAVFAADAGGNVNTFRQALQLEYTTRLAGVISADGKKNYDYPSQSMALRQLKRIDLIAARQSGVNVETRAHREHLALLIRQALDEE
jgi:hypothetical protein